MSLPDRTEQPPTADGPDPSEQKPEVPHSVASTIFRGKLTVQSGQPLVISERQADVSALAEEQSAQTHQIGQALKAYREAAKVLLAEKYPEMREFAPPQMRTVCDCLAIICDDGIVVRYDRHEGGDPKVRVGGIQGDDNSVAGLVPKISEGYVHCPIDPTTYQLPPDGPRVQLSTTNVATGETSQLFDAQLAIVVPWGELRQHTQASVRPVPLVSVSNEIEVAMQGELFDESEPTEPGSGQQFVLRSHAKLRMGWEAFEVYPPFDAATWQPSIAPMWAELDLRAVVARRNLRDQQFQALDPRAATRKQYMSVFKKFKALLNGPEAPVQEFLKEHPELLCPTHSKMWPKFRLGARVTDFVFREHPNDYLMVEIEAPTRTLFRKDGQRHLELTTAMDQVTDWRRYIEDNLSTVQHQLGLTEISASPRCLIVIGRSANLTPTNKRKLVTLQNEIPKLRIMTYDDLLATAKATIENLLGPLFDTQGNAEVYFVSTK